LFSPAANSIVEGHSKASLREKTVRGTVAASALFRRITSTVKLRLSISSDITS